MPPLESCIFQLVLSYAIFCTEIMICYVASKVFVMPLGSVLRQNSSDLKIKYDVIVFFLNSISDLKTD